MIHLDRNSGFSFSDLLDETTYDAEAIEIWIQGDFAKDHLFLHFFGNIWGTGGDTIILRRFSESAPQNT